MHNATDVLADALATAIIIKLTPLLAIQGAGIKPRLLTVEQAGAYIGRTAKAVRHLLDTDAFPSVRPDGRIMVDIQDLNQWIERSKT